MLQNMVVVSLDVKGRQESAGESTVCFLVKK